MKNTTTALIALLLSVAICTKISAATVNPVTYKSDNNHYALFVDPSNKNGIGATQYTFSENNQVLWSKTFDETFIEVKISSEGHIFAYSYSIGIDADYHLLRKGLENNLTLWMLNKQGEMLVQQVMERGLEAQPMHGNIQPISYGINIKEHTDTVSFRLSPQRKDNKKLEHWYQFSASTGAKKPNLLIDFTTQAHYDRAWIEHLVEIPDSPYYLLEMRQRVYIDSIANSHGSSGYMSDSLFYLMNTAGEVVWSDVNLGDLRFEYKSKTGKQWRRYLDHHALIDYDTSTHQFSIQHLKQQQIISYQIGKDLQIKEIGRKPLQPFIQTTAKATVEQQPPKFLYAINLENKSTNSELPSRFSAFAINGKNQFGTLVKEGKNLYFYLINPDNSLLKKLPIQAELDDYDVTSVVAKKNSSWLFLASQYEENPRLFELNTQSELIIEIAVDAPGGGRMVLHDNENFTILASEGGDYLRHFDKQGKILWTLREDEYDMPGYLSTPTDITLTGDNQLIVLDNIGNKLNFYTTEGVAIKTIKFSETSHGELNYPGLLKVIDDVVYVEDDEDSTVIHRYALDGKWLDSNVLKQKSKKKLKYIRDLQADSAGNLWVSGAGLYKFDDSLNNTQIIGQSQQQQLFNDISAIQTDSKGDIYLFNHENFSVIKISAKGEQKAIFSIPAEQIPTGSFSTESMFIDDEDQVYINSDLCKYAVFNASGEFLKEFQSSHKCGEHDHINLTANQNQSSFWRSEEDRITLENYRGNEFKILQTITKDSDSQWLNRVGDLVTDKKGRLLATGDRSDNFSEQNQVIYVFDQHGLPISTLPVKDYVASVAFAGDYIYLNYSNEQQIRVLNLNGQQVTAFTDKNAKQENCKTTLLYADEAHNKLYVYGAKTLSVYELLK